MKFSVLTMFPDQFHDFRSFPIPARAEKSGNAEIQIVDIREFAGGSFRHIDDSPYGGGAGMVLRIEPVVKALRSVTDLAYGKDVKEPHIILFAPTGKQYTQADARRLAEEEHLILLCGHYEGMDARVYDYADEVISLGDYILSGGELASMILMDSIIRLLSGNLRKESTEDESFEHGLLEYPQYTRPAEFEGKRVPDVLLSGNHEEIRKWREEQSIELTKNLRPDLYERYLQLRKESTE